MSGPLGTYPETCPISYEQHLALLAYLKLSCKNPHLQAVHHQQIDKGKQQIVKARAASMRAIVHNALKEAKGQHFLIKDCNLCLYFCVQLMLAHSI